MTKLIESAVKYVESELAKLFVDYSKQQQEIRASVWNDSERALAQSFTKLFQRLPALQTIEWESRVEWNDQCNEWFSGIQEYYLTINGIDEVGAYALRGAEAIAHRNLTHAVASFLYHLTPEQNFRTLFGDGARIKVERGPNGNAYISVEMFETLDETCGENYY